MIRAYNHGEDGLDPIYNYLGDQILNGVTEKNRLITVAGGRVGAFRDEAEDFRRHVGFFRGLLTEG